jgi:hypothetical protein
LITERPAYWLDPRWQRGEYDGPLGDITGLGTVAQSGGPSVGYNLADNAHQASFAYVPYLMTGDRYYLDELVFWSNFAVLHTWPNSGLKNRGELGEGYLFPSNQIRGVAWALRNLADATAYLPDSHPLRAYFSTIVANNLRRLDQEADALAASGRPLETSFEYVQGATLNMALWEADYLAYAIQRANDQGFSGGTKMRDRIVRFHLSLFTAGTAFPREYASPYRPIVGDVVNGQWRYLPTLRDIWLRNYVTTDPPQPPQPFVGYHGVSAYLSMLIADKQRMPGAYASLAYVESILGRSASAGSEFASRPGWALDRCWLQDTACTPAGSSSRPLAPSNVRIKP